MSAHVQANDPTRAGQSASEATIFGQFNRYRVEAIHTRFDAVDWFVFDAEWPDEVTGEPSVIRQASTRADAVLGLEELGIT